MKIESITEGKVVSYKARKASGRGKVVQKYQDTRPTWWVVVHDKARNASVTVRPSQTSAR